MSRFSSGPRSRADLVASGELIEAPASLVAEAGIRYPVALTRAAWEDAVAWTDADNDRKGTIQDETGRLWDVLWMSRIPLTWTNPYDRDGVTVALYRTPRPGRARKPRRVSLHAVIGWDYGRPVVTVGLPGEL
ncbi:DUF6573 family protein [Nonomuraea sp. NPDC050536]|uniref:DUF6573 family protein n=1 Tax=Nonomuraea sp. NPDC050536 TaxID=3364366 RepID=UPI0037C9C8F2